MKLVLRLDVGRWSRILRVWEIVKNRHLTPDDKAINAIVRTFQKRTAAGLQSGRDFVIPDKQEQATDASVFELITWLVIKSGETDG
jgi:hypothetical protein